jgi:ABC-type transporter Mla maintaining outer membrane lipid asymmetry ATPase subunit MlaF
MNHPLQHTTPGAFAIETSGLTLRFGTLTAVDHISLGVPSGEIFGLLGIWAWMSPSAGSR